MSKAFTKEGEGEDEDEERPKRPAGSRYITRQGHAKLVAELDRLWKVERPKVTSEVSWAAAQGDRSENAEYIYGKRRLREIDRRIRYLGKRLDVLTVVEPSKAQHGKVFFGAYVTIEDPEGAEIEYRIVGPDELDVGKGLISIESPLARALLGKREGDEVTVQRPRGPVELTIVKIRYGE